MDTYVGTMYTYHTHITWLMTTSCVDGRMYKYVHTRTKTIDFLRILSVIRGGDSRSQKVRAVEWVWWVALINSWCY